jgi:hypothetical protein
MVTEMQLRNSSPGDLYLTVTVNGVFWGVTVWQGVSGEWYAELASPGIFGPIGTGSSNPEAVSDLISKMEEHV